MTTVDLEAIETRLEAATPGLWATYKTTSGLWMIFRKNRINHIDPIAHKWPLHIADDVRGERNASFIANAPTDIALLISEVRRLRERVGELESQE